MLIEFDKKTMYSASCISIHKISSSSYFQIGEMRKRALHFPNIIVFMPYLAFVRLRTFFLSFLMSFAICSNDFYYITFVWTILYAYDKALACS